METLSITKMPLNAFGWGSDGAAAELLKALESSSE
jgi:hypothetical protein